MSAEKRNVQQIQVYFTKWSDYHRQLREPRGLPNSTGEECYKNSVFILLLHAPVVVNWIMLHEENDCTIADGDDYERCLPCHFRAFFEEYWLHRESNIALLNHLHCLKSTIALEAGWEHEGQQDVVEYLGAILNTLGQQVVSR